LSIIGVTGCLTATDNILRLEETESMGSVLDVAEIIKQINGNKELMAQIAKADPKQGVELLKKANIDVSEDDIKKVQAAVADGKLDLGDLKNLAGGLFKK
jgi:uncharacterized protein with PhoU and TrkA domain